MKKSIMIAGEQLLFIAFLGVKTEKFGSFVKVCNFARLVMLSLLWGCKHKLSIIYL
jgi:hypothetical protein